MGVSNNNLEEVLKTNPKNVGAFKNIHGIFYWKYVGR